MDDTLCVVCGGDGFVWVYDVFEGQDGPEEDAFDRECDACEGTGHSPTATKPIRVFYSTLTKRFYASQHYQEKGDHIVITGRKYDVTNDVAHAVVTHELEFTPTDTEDA